MAAFNNFLNHALISILIVVMVMVARDALHTRMGRILVALCFSIVCLLINGLVSITDYPILYCATFLLSIPHIGLAWWFMLELLRDDFQLSADKWLGIVLMSLVPTLYFLDILDVQLPLWEEINILGSVIPLLMITHIALVAWSEKNNDLLEPRRRARTWMVVILIVAFVVSLLSEWFDDPLYASLMSFMFALPASMILLLWLARIHPQVLHFETSTGFSKSTSTSTIKSQEQMDVKQVALMRELSNTMQEQLAYQQHGLTINTLASLLNTQEHRLRTLINQRLGYRNFSAFLSHYRLQEVKKHLADPDKSDVPITTLALEVGFSSLQTFNRVFKNNENCTPSEYRQHHLANMSDNHTSQN